MKAAFSNRGKTQCDVITTKELDLYGIRRFMESARLFLTDGTDSEIWEAKHRQDDLVNFTTRGNVSLYCKDKLEELMAD